MSQFTLTPDQQAAAQAFTLFMLDPSQHHMILRGPAGCGKSVLTKHILASVEGQQKLQSLITQQNPGKPFKKYVTATTNKAAQVVGNILNEQPRTIHSLLGLKVTNDYKTGETRLEKTNNYKVYENSLILIDEASFVDQKLLDLIQDSTLNCKTLWIGDPYQLAPTFEPTCPVFDLNVNTIELTTIKRNSGPIAQLAEAFRHTVGQVMQIDQQLAYGQLSATQALAQKQQILFPAIQANNQSILHLDGPGFQQAVNQAYAQPCNDTSQHKILAWTNQKVHQYNEYCRGLLGLQGPLTRNEVVVTNKPILGTRYTTDSQVRITQVGKPTSQLDVPGNVIEVNGDHQLFMPHDQRQVQQLLRHYAKAKQWSEYFRIKDVWGDLRPIHACTVHKSQGSTYRRVFIDLADIGRCTQISDVARMLYVAVSRAAEQVVFYGQLPSRFRINPHG